MAVTTFIKIDDFYTIGLTVSATTLSTYPIAPGDSVQLTSAAIIRMIQAADDVTFVGIANGSSDAGNVGGTICPVARVCFIESTMTSATYAMGQGFKWAARCTYVDDGGANTLGWIADNDSATRTKATLYVNVFQLAAVASDAKLFTTAVA